MTEVKAPSELLTQSRHSMNVLLFFLLQMTTLSGGLSWLPLAEKTLSLPSRPCSASRFY